MQSERRHSILCCRFSSAAVNEVSGEGRICQFPLSERLPSAIWIHYEDQSVLHSAVSLNT